MTSPLPPPRPWGLAEYGTGPARRGLPSEEALQGHVLQEPVEGSGARGTWDTWPGLSPLDSFKFKFWCSPCWPQVTLRTT